MTTTRVNNLSCTISNTPGVAGSIVISAARAGYVQFGAAQDGQTFSVVNAASSASTAEKEVRTGCVYTHSTRTLTRGTLESSTTGAALDLTSAAIVTVTLTAAIQQQLAAQDAARAAPPQGE